jgi:glycosyltransferase involved in cell wall biosynthesis
MPDRLPDRSSSTPLLSIIIPVHNGGETIALCLSSIIDSSFTDYEIIVVDDGSSDNTTDIVAKFPCHLIRLTESRGAARARNQGAALARGKYLFFTDSDIMIQKNTLQKLIDILDSDTGYHAVIGSYTKHTRVNNFLSVFKNYCHHFTHQKSREEALTFWTGCGGIEKRIFIKQGGFSESYTSASIEDIEFGYRLSRQGYRIKLAKSIQVTHLKRYTLSSLIRSDVLNRAVPWTTLMLDSHTFQSDLNTTFANAVSVFTVQLIPFTILLSLYNEDFLHVVFAEMVLFSLCNMDFYHFLIQNDDFAFTIKSVAMSFVYFYYSGLGLLLGFANYLKERILS